MAVVDQELALLCEGTADRTFFAELTARRAGVPKFAMPFPTDTLSGNGAFGGMLTALKGAGRGFEQLRGVLIVADSTHDPGALFTSVRTQVRGVGGFPVPTRPGELVVGTKDYPAIEVMLLPADDAPGCLETLFAAELARNNPGALECVEALLRCGPIDAHLWPAEKLDKARFHCLVATLNKGDPSKAASRVCVGSAPVISVTATRFDTIASRLRAFDAGARRA